MHQQTCEAAKCPALEEPEAIPEDLELTIEKIEEAFVGVHRAMLVSSVPALDPIIRVAA